MARKRKIIHSYKGSSKRAKKSMGGSRKKFRTGRTRLRPEVKYAGRAEAEIGIKNFKGATVDLAVADVKTLINFPAQGTTDVTRIGDTIMAKKLYVRLFLYQTDTQAQNASAVRIIIFNLRTDLPTTDIGAFWQSAIGPNSINGVVNREVVNKVFYDKVVIFQPNVSGTSVGVSKGVYLKPKNINISMRWPIVFAAGSQLPKDPRNKIFIHVTGFSDPPAAGVLLGQYSFNSNFYFTDS